MKAAALILAALGLLSATDGRYARALALGAIAAGTAAVGLKKQRREERHG